MLTLTLFFLQRTFFLELWSENKVLCKSVVEDHTKLLTAIDDLLALHSLKLENLKRFYSIAGPGSFSSLRIVYGTLSAVKQVFPSMQCGSFALEELCEGTVLVKLNKNIYLIYDGDWKTVFACDLDKNKTYTTLENYDNLKQNIINDLGKRMNKKNISVIQEPLYVYMPVQNSPKLTTS